MMRALAEYDVLLMPTTRMMASKDSAAGCADGSADAA